MILFKVEAEVIQGDEDSEGWMEHKSPDLSNIEKMTHESVCWRWGACDLRSTRESLNLVLWFFFFSTCSVFYTEEILIIN